MEESNSLWMIGSMAFVGGILAGAILYRLVKGGTPQQNRLEAQLRNMEDQFKDYQDKVSDHFSTTAHLVNKLTESYKDVNEHLAASSQYLCNDEVTKQRLSDSLLTSNTLLSSAADDIAQPPLDYSDSKGTLSEEFGVLKEDLSNTQKMEAQRG